jgi:hypothetical protein
VNRGVRIGLCAALLTALYAGHVHLKTAKIFNNPTWDRAEDTGQFWSEFAVHYRFARFFADHPVGEWGELSRDRRVQFPDTINSWAEFAIAMEVPVGLAYRWCEPAAPFHVWVVWYNCLVSSLSLFAIFLLARALWGGDAAGLLAAALYAGLYPSYGRTVRNLFPKEDFAVPLILFALWLTVWAMQPQPAGAGGAPASADNAGRGCAGRAVLAGLAWVAALASWHLTQFVLAVFVAAMVMVWAWKPTAPATVASLGRLKWTLAVVAAGGLLVPMLRAKQFYLSPAMCALYGLALAMWTDGARRKQLAVFFGASAALALAGMALPTGYGEYGHVYQLFLHKLRFLGVKPDDPSRLPWEARVLWEGAFNTAGRGEWWRSLQWCGPLGLVGVWLCRRPADAHSGGAATTTARRMTAVFALLLVPLSWMVVRYFTFLGFAAAVMAAGCAAWPRAGRVRLLGAIAGVLAVLWQFAALERAPLERAPANPAAYVPVARWLADNTGPDDVILASISESPVFLAHTGRPIILHSKFENRDIRRRYRQLLETIYDSEDVFHEFATRHGADWFIFDPGFVYLPQQDPRESRRYKADRLGELDPDCAALLFWAGAERLRRFELAFATEWFGVYRVLP